MSNLKYGLKKPEDDLKVDLENEILNAVKDHYTTFIVSVSTVIDIWAARIVLRLKSRFPDLKLVIAADRTFLPDDILSHADYVYPIFDEKLIDAVSLVIAVYNGRAIEPIRYARTIHIPVRYVAG